MSLIGLKQWSLFNHTDTNILSQITLAHVFSETRSVLGVIYVDHLDQVYGKGYNGKFHKLGVANHKEIIVWPINIPSLSGENICTILTGFRHGAALSRNGNVFFWGLDLSYQDYSQDKVTMAPKMINTDNLMKGETGQQIACSSNGLLVLTKSGKLLLWSSWCDSKGNSIHVQGEIAMPTSPTTIVGGGWHFGVTVVGSNLFTFGDGACGQLGYEWKEGDGFDRPRRVKLPDTVSAVACNQQATLVMLQPWSLYIFGDNSRKSLGVPKENDIVFTPERINLSAPVRAIFASLYDNLFYAQAANEKSVYRWGFDASLVKLQAMEVSSVIEAFANRSTPSNSMQPDAESDSSIGIVPDMVPPSHLTDLCNKELFSDVTIKLAEGEFKGHRSILHASSEHFRALLNTCWIEGQSNVIDMSNYDSTAYRAYLNYLYRGYVDQLEPIPLAHLYMIADQYLDSKLKEYCCNKFNSLIKVETVGQLYRAAHAASSEKLAHDCYNFALKNVKAVQSYVMDVNLEEYLQLLLSV